MPRNDDGFTLIEAIVAASLLVAVSLGTAQLFGFALAQNLVARQQLVMGLLASSKLDELSSAIDAGSVVLTTADALERSLDGSTDTVLDAGRTYVRRWRIAQVPGYGDAFAVAVRVLPATGGGDVRVVTVRASGAP